MGAVKSKRMPRAVREQQMLDAAVRTFGQRGYRAASMDEIAELAGVSKPLVYLYLNSKEDLFTACIRREVTALTTAVRAGVDPELPADRQLWEGLRAFFTHTARNPDAWAVLHLQARTHGEPFAAEVAAMREDMVAFVTGLILVGAREARRDPSLPEREVAGLAEGLVGAAEALAAWANATPGITARQAAATLMNFAWAGLGDLMEGRPWTPPPVGEPGE
ncbi:MULTISPECIES: TetR/AcrR family transcriptional regulator [Streptomyces]|uniref:AcrR family transcriptional regulator n=1 Tax=Streptomyces stelliscabiei TaxID=146820 RepID=A0A8I0TVD8_9ACTN|nr:MULTISPECIES: TetR/AcrR family transcriptional regulator [Streptomyces]KND46037.1 TetR family transcriptional regulator [Streptomyces stelliscabiei]MBE1599288.1 AcrR family transcriptional regulator [Streptomyces stelliscabiei]MDX2520178.1 TetR/AcrR family transcriptional regulator [Streptomyces stelliscabiei]MDX2556968.1 TetR/AcrR family transcriptional regulator [Streptomyces stelliscabiei]MDX2615934.1 TetR/AcrR family transcriptional regulator [Streptomyces stelliscabiei]